MRFLPSLTFLSICAVCAVSGYLTFISQHNQIILWCFLISLVVIALCLHEYAHALIAYSFGDKSVVGKGYLTLNPIKYAHFSNSILLPILFLFIGGLPLPGGAVYLDFSAIRSRVGETLTSAAGLIINVVTTILLVETVFYFNSGSNVFWAVIAFFVYIEIGVILLNSLPIPGFDGYGILSPWLPSSIRDSVDEHSHLFGLLPFALFLFPNPLMDKIWSISYELTLQLGFFPNLIKSGQGFFKIDQLIDSIMLLTSRSLNPIIEPFLSSPIITKLELFVQPLVGRISREFYIGSLIAVSAISFLILFKFLKNRFKINQNCKWRKDSIQPIESRTRWRCLKCGEFAFVENGLKPKRCERGRWRDYN